MPPEIPVDFRSPMDPVEGASPGIKGGCLHTWAIVET